MIAHELQHVVQQADGPQSVAKKGLSLGAVGSFAERDADKVAGQVMGRLRGDGQQSGGQQLGAAQGATDQGALEQGGAPRSGRGGQRGPQGLSLSGSVNLGGVQIGGSVQAKAQGVNATGNVKGAVVGQQVTAVLNEQGLDVSLGGQGQRGKGRGNGKQPAPAGTSGPKGGSEVQSPPGVTATPGMMPQTPGSQGANGGAQGAGGAKLGGAAKSGGAAGRSQKAGGGGGLSISGKVTIGGVQISGAVQASDTGVSGSAKARTLTVCARRSTTPARAWTRTRCTRRSRAWTPSSSPRSNRSSTTFRTRWTLRPPTWRRSTRTRRPRSSPPTRRATSKGRSMCKVQTRTSLKRWPARAGRATKPRSTGSRSSARAPVAPSRRGWRSRSTRTRSCRSSSTAPIRRCVPRHIRIRCSARPASVRATRTRTAAVTPPRCKTRWARCTRTTPMEKPAAGWSRTCCPRVRTPLGSQPTAST
ncbi:MAG: hypothetical protein EXR69_09415 [Myxococcales bacterium]|nr:hypothetical protein [Myxococcales bacterium]